MTKNQDNLHNSTEGSLPNDIALQEKLMQSKDSNDLKETLPINDVRHKEAAKVDDDGDRETWGKKVDFLLSVIGFAVDLANVWRFPYLCYKNGGGAFLIPYGMMLILGGIPLFYMELALGQYNRKGAITCWGRICPLFKGVGYTVVLIAFFTDFFYNVIIAWALYFFFASFTSNLPWVSCENIWNTKNCYDGLSNETKKAHVTFNGSVMLRNMSSPIVDISKRASSMINMTTYSILNGSVINGTNMSYIDSRVSPAREYFERSMLELHRSQGIHNLGGIKWQLALCLLAVYLICYFSLWKGISTSGKVVWFTALFPYVVLLILLVRGATLPGAATGIKYYLTPNFTRLAHSQVWVDAATQVFFSLGPGFGVLLAFSSYNKFHNNVYKDAIATSLINCATSFLSGFVIFSVLGYMSEKSKKPIDKVATEGPGLVFMVYPEAIATLPASTFWALIFFMMLLTLGLDSSFGGSEAIITALSDEYPIIKRKREWFVAGLFAFYYVIGLGSCTYGGAYVVTLFDKFAAGYSILFAVFFEAMALSWFYGVDRFSNDIKEMLGFKPGRYWRICWKYIAPVFILCILIFGFAKYEPLTYEDYDYPWWASLVGWCIALSSILCMPGMAIYKIIRTPGTLVQRLKILTTPWKDCVKQHTDLNSITAVPLNGNNPHTPIDAV